jgi:integrase
MKKRMKITMAKKNKNTVRKDGLISVQVYLGRDENGKRSYKTVYGRTQREAEEKALHVKAALRKGLDVGAEHETFGTWADRWLRIKSTEVSTGRLNTYKSHVKHLNRCLEYAEIAKIRTSDIQSLITDMAARNPNTGKPTAKKTLIGIKGTAAQIMRLAIDNRIMDYNPAKAVKLPNVRIDKMRRALTGQEQAWIEELPNRARRAAMIMMYSGLRRGELIPLTWNDVDLKAKTVSVTKSTEFIGGVPMLKESAKTAAGVRTVDIPQKPVDFLKGEKRESLYVCVNAKGTMHTESSWRRMWESYLSDLNMTYGDFGPFVKRPKSKFDPAGVPFVIPKITPHWLRHTFCTLLYLAGVDVLTAMKQMGHADIKTTLGIYTHLDAKYKRKAMNKLDDYLSNASSMQV